MDISLHSFNNDWGTLANSIVGDILRERGIKVASNSVNTALTFFNKWYTHTSLKEKGFNVPNAIYINYNLLNTDKETPDWTAVNQYKEYVFHEIKKLKFPIIIKSVTGTNSAGICIAKTLEDVDNFLNSNSAKTDFIAEEFIKGREYGVLNVTALLGKKMYNYYDQKSKVASQISEKKLLKNMKKNKNTEFGKKYDFCNIKNIKDFQQKIPFTTYEDYMKYIERTANNGEQNLITTDKIYYFAATSGTTGIVKKIPVVKRTYITFLENGTIDDSIKMPENVRKKLQKELKPNKQRADQLRKIFSESTDYKGIVPKIWKRISIVNSIGTGDFSPLLMDELEIGKDYEIVVTNFAGLYRYKLKDVVKVVGYKEKVPIIQYGYRKNQLVNISGLHVTTEQFAKIIQNYSEILHTKIVDYSLYVDIDHSPVRMVIFIETEETVNIKEDVSQLFDEQVNVLFPGFDEVIKKGVFSKSQVHFVKTGTYEMLRERKIKSGVPVNQIKTVRIIKEKDTLEYFLNSIIS